MKSVKLLLSWKFALPVACTALLLAGGGTYFRYWLRSTIIVDGKKISAPYRPVTTGALLAHMNIVPGERDIVDPPLTAPMPRHGTIRVIRVSEKTETLKEELPFRILSKETYTRNLRPVELQRGVLKVKARQVRIVYHDGREVTRQTVKERVTKKIVYRLALLDAKGNIEKIYDLSSSRKMRMVATAYYPGDPLAWKDGTETYLGLKMQRGIVAVDPRVIPLRTRVYVSGYGYGYAGDTGSAIKRRRIDLGVNNAQEEKAFMHRRVTVYILDKNEKW